MEMGGRPQRVDLMLSFLFSQINTEINNFRSGIGLCAEFPTRIHFKIYWFFITIYRGTYEENYSAKTTETGKFLNKKVFTKK